MTQEQTRFADVEWVGNAKEELLAFPPQVVTELGRALRRLQRGETPQQVVRPMQSIGPGVYELKESDERTWYRMVYLAVIDEVIYVLHCFEKSSRKTDRRDIRTARARLVLAKQMVQERRAAQ